MPKTHYPNHIASCSSSSVGQFKLVSSTNGEDFGFGPGTGAVLVQKFTLPVYSVPGEIENEEQFLFHAACELRNSKYLKSFLKTGQIEPNGVDKNGTSFLHRACSKDIVDFVKILLDDNRTNPNLTDNQGRTPFFLACELGHFKLAEVLMEDPRVDFLKRDNQGTDPFDLVCRPPHLLTTMIKRKALIDVEEKKRNK